MSRFSLLPVGRVGAIILAAGQSRRMDGLDKLFAPLLGFPLLRYSVKTFTESPFVDQVVMVMGMQNHQQGKTLADSINVDQKIAVCLGGPRRQDSVMQGLTSLWNCDWVIIHDGARPCVTGDMLEAGLEAAQETGAAVPVISVSDTIKLVSDQWVEKTLPRDRLRAAQTPQVFSRDLLLQAHRSVTVTATDDAAMVEYMGCRVKVFEGSLNNLKVTTVHDLANVEAILKREF